MSRNRMLSDSQKPSSILFPNTTPPTPKGNHNKVVPKYSQGIGSRTSTHTKILRCSSPLYKMV